MLSLILAVLFMVTIIPHSEGCSCFPSHRQHTLCQDKAVLVFKVKSEKIILFPDPEFPYPDEIQYTVKVKRVLKDESGQNIQQNDVIIVKTAGDGARCGVRLAIGETYLNAGGLTNDNSIINMYASSCGYLRNWKNLNKKQKKEQRTYLKNCNCPINVCFDEDCDRSPPCTFVPFSPESWCYSNHAVCKSKGNKCDWRDKDRSDKKLEKCLADANDV